MQTIAQLEDPPKSHRRTHIFSSSFYGPLIKLRDIQEFVYFL